MKNRRYLSVILAGVCLVLFLLLAFKINKADRVIQSFISNHQNTNLSLIMNFVSFFGSEIFISVISLVIIAFFYFRKEFKKIKIFCFSIIGVLIGYLIKLIVQRDRPFNLIETNYSFPSEHTLAVVIVCFFIFYFILNRKNKYSFLIFDYKNKI